MKKKEHAQKAAKVAALSVCRRMNYYLISGGLGSLVINSKLVSQSELSAKLAGAQIFSPKSGFLNERAPGFCATVLRGTAETESFLRIMRKQLKVYLVICISISPKPG